MDSYDREEMIAWIVFNVLGEDVWWPVNGDGPNALEEFWAKFVPAAQAQGYEILDAVAA